MATSVIFHIALLFVNTMLCNDCLVSDKYSFNFIKIDVIRRRQIWTKSMCIVLLTSSDQTRPSCTNIGPTIIHPHTSGLLTHTCVKVAPLVNAPIKTLIYHRLQQHLTEQDKLLSF